MIQADVAPPYVYGPWMVWPARTCAVTRIGQTNRRIVAVYTEGACRRWASVSQSASCLAASSGVRP